MTAAAFALTGCDDPGATTGTEIVVGSPSAAATPPGGSGTGASGLPDVCTLLTKEEVTALAGGASVLQVDRDDAAPDATVRYCQWQLSGARLAIQLGPTTEADFGTNHPDSEPVTDLGYDAHFFSNHLFIRKGHIEVDIYATTPAGGDADKLFAKAAATQVLPRLP
ncbi:DUF3558 family protein [Luedemannella helvata]|uniref:DUF3558 domain-containing protein n=1 Tax=Luedemannella helvata TaxID=349315 RepID=A0ABN2K6Y5_9ACTN